MNDNAQLPNDSKLDNNDLNNSDLNNNNLGDNELNGSKPNNRDLNNSEYASSDEDRPDNAEDHTNESAEQSNKNTDDEEITLESLANTELDDEFFQRSAAEANVLIMFYAFNERIEAERLRLQRLDSRVGAELDGSYYLDMSQIHSLLQESQALYDKIQHRIDTWRSHVLFGGMILKLCAGVDVTRRNIDNSAFVANDLINYSQKLEAAFKRAYAARRQYFAKESAAFGDYTVWAHEEDTYERDCSDNCAAISKDLRGVMQRLGEVSALLEDYLSKSGTDLVGQDVQLP